MVCAEASANRVKRDRHGVMCRPAHRPWPKMTCASWLAAMVAEEARSAESSNCSLMRSRPCRGAGQAS